MTKKERIEVKEALAKLEERLDSRFYKTHRRCIVNLHNVKRFDFNLGIIKFENQEIDMLARNNRKDLKDMTWKRCGLGGIVGMVKVRVNHIGRIVSVGEY